MGKEAKARFTQSNNTPFLSKPLLSDLGLIGMASEKFDQIA